MTYESSAIQRARDYEQGRPWRYALPHPMTVVTRIQDGDDRSAQQEVTRLSYRDGFFDGDEQQFRGYEEVTLDRPG